MAIAYFKTRPRKEETFYSTCTVYVISKITLEWYYLLIRDVKASQIIGSITEEMQKSISRSSYNFRYCFIAIFLRNNKTAEKGKKNIWKLNKREQGNNSKHSMHIK